MSRKLYEGGNYAHMDRLTVREFRREAWLDFTDYFANNQGRHANGGGDGATLVASGDFWFSLLPNGCQPNLFYQDQLNSLQHPYSQREVLIHSAGSFFGQVLFTPNRPVHTGAGEPLLLLRLDRPRPYQTHESESPLYVGVNEQALGCITVRPMTDVHGFEIIDPTLCAPGSSDRIVDALPADLSPSLQPALGSARR